MDVVKKKGEIVLPGDLDETRGRQLEIECLVDSIIEHSVGATVFVDAEGRVLRSGAAATRLLLENPTGRLFDDAFPLTLPDAQAAIPARAEADRFSIMTVLEGAVFDDLEAAMVRSDGTTLSLLIAAKILKPYGGRFKGAIVTLLDLTPRKKAEVQFQVRNQQLRFHLELTKTITDNTSEALFLADAEGRIHFMNPAAERMLGWNAAELAGKVFHDVVHPVHDPVLNPIDSCCLSRKTDINECETTEDVFMGKDGKPISVRYSRAPVVTDGKLTGAVIGVGDITGRKISEEALRFSEEKLRQSQKIEAVGRLAGGIAHDFNNLLTAINGYAALGLRLTEPGDTLNGYLEEIKASGERAAALTGQLLSYSRKRVLAPRILDLNAIVRDTVAIVERTLGAAISFRIELHPGPCLVKADPIHIQQVLVNLALNARDAMPKGGTLCMRTAPVHIEVTDRTGFLGETAGDAEAGLQPGEYVRFTIIDDGEGMDEKTKAHLFEPFFTTKQVGSGTGLGLSMAYGIIKEHRGLIQVYSALNEGSTIQILLPAASPEKAMAPIAPMGAEASPGQETLLLVEDESVVLGLMKTVLTAQGYTVLSASGGAEALEVLERHPVPVHLLITDVVMNDMDGYTLAEAFNLLRPGVPRIFISGYNENPGFRREIRDDHAQFLGKPFTSAALVGLVRRTLDLKRATAP
jgi:two-component system cell cycle sensor histidine kinase/response regulator CckA